MKFVKLLTIPVVLLISAVMAVPASAHVVNTAAFTIGCGSDTAGGPANQICVTLDGSLSGFTDRFIFVDVFPAGADINPDKQGNFPNSLGETSFEITANTKLPVKVCFKTLTSSATAFTVAITKVTSDKAGKMPADAEFDKVTVNGANFAKSPIVFNADQQTPIALTDAAPKCATTQPPTNSGGSGGGTPVSPTPATTTLAQTGGLDLRFPLIGLVVLAAGGVLFVVSATRRRSAQTK